MRNARGARREREEWRLPIVRCRLSSNDLRARAHRWRQLRDEAGLEWSTTEDGLRLRFADERAVEEELQALVALERECCAWARWEIHREDGELTLRVASAGTGVAALHAMLGGVAASDDAKAAR